jgi:hypothetical protein
VYGARFFTNLLVSCVQAFADTAVPRTHTDSDAIVENTGRAPYTSDCEGRRHLLKEMRILGKFMVAMAFQGAEEAESCISTNDLWQLG